MTTALGLLLLAVTGCSGTEAEPPPAELTGAGLRELLREHLALQRPITVEVLSGVRSTTGDHLVASGFLKLEDPARMRFALTPRGQASGLVEKVFEVGSPFFVVPVAHLELVDVSEPTPVPRVTPTRMVEFTYRAVPGEVGHELLRRRSDLPALHRAGLHRGRAALVRYAEGWDVQRVEL